jgi:chromosome partitioning protein
MQTITFLNEKGGVGKTTMAVLLASYLAHEGHMTLLIDADSQGHATLSVRAKRRDGLYALIKNGEGVQDVAVPVDPNYYEGDTGTPTLGLIPSSSRTAELAEGINANTLNLKLQEVDNVFDFVIIDTSPSISNLHLSFYLASDYIIYPTECTYMPMQGLFKSLKHLEKARGFFAERNLPVADILGIVPTKFSGRESVQHQNHGYLMGKYEELVLPPIRRLTDFEKSSQMRTPVFLYEPSGNAAKDAIQFVEEVMQRLGVTTNA